MNFYSLFKFVRLKAERGAPMTTQKILLQLKEVEPDVNLMGCRLEMNISNDSGGRRYQALRVSQVW